ncbi:MFS transporter permease [Cumulibacter manganitolerans]|uniref:MFS transporter permease n=1 Tax=Cumulibacter manganitolerans TaxID=1884992 RepID=UPI001295E9CF|nr:MFS transporter permease [Cumulibacter manganitolerans]
MTQIVTTPPRRGVARWLLEPLPVHRIAVMRVIAYLFVLVDVFLTTSWVAQKAYAPESLYRPLHIAELLHLPHPTFGYVTTVKWLLVALAVVAATGWRPRLTGSAVAVLYLLWMVVGMSYGKVDHDRFAYLVLLFLLPTAGAARWGERRWSEAAGFALQMTFVAVMLTYFLAAVAKVRYGGWDWPTGATLTRAFIRRGTPLVEWVLGYPWMLVGAQFAMIVLEALSPLILLCRSPRARILLVCGLLLFHVMVFASVTIIFLPHCIAILSILPWERFSRRARDEQPREAVAQPA